MSKIKKIKEEIEQCRIQSNSFISGADLALHMLDRDNEKYTMNEIRKALLELDEEECSMSELINQDIQTVLEKACYDEYYYAAKITTGDVIYFRSATIIDDTWIHLQLDYDTEEGRKAKEARWMHSYHSDRGLDVKKEHIVWIMDAPQGS